MLVVSGAGHQVYDNLAGSHALTIAVVEQQSNEKGGMEVVPYKAASRGDRCRTFCRGEYRLGTPRQMAHL